MKKYHLIVNPIIIEAETEEEAIDRLYSEPWNYIDVNLIEEEE